MASQPLHRIVSLAPPLTEILGYLGFSHQVTEMSEYFDETPPKEEDNHPAYWYTMAEERVASVRPELVLTLFPSQWELHKRFKDLGLNTLHLDPRSLREVEDGFRMIGKAAGTVDEARQLALDFAGGLAGLKEKVPGGVYRPKLYCEEWNQPPTVPGGWYPDLMTDAGAHYFPMLSREMSRVARLEEVAMFDPEVIIFAIRGSEGVSFNPNEALKRMGWEKINAVKKRRLYTVDSAVLNRPGLRLIEGAKAVQQILGQTFWGWPLATSPLFRKVLD
jgi:iron complex transport system substrate-binding protein